MTTIHDMKDDRMTQRLKPGQVAEFHLSDGQVGPIVYQTTARAFIAERGYSMDLHDSQRIEELERCMRVCRTGARHGCCAGGRGINHNAQCVTSSHIGKNTLTNHPTTTHGNLAAQAGRLAIAVAPDSRSTPYRGNRGKHPLATK